MKMTMIKMAAIMGGLGMAGYMYLKKHPEKVEMMRCACRDASKMIYNKLEQE